MSTNYQLVDIEENIDIVGDPKLQLTKLLQFHFFTKALESKPIFNDFQRVIGTDMGHDRTWVANNITPIPNLRILLTSFSTNFGA